MFVEEFPFGTILGEDVYFQFFGPKSVGVILMKIVSRKYYYNFGIRQYDTEYTFGAVMAVKQREPDPAFGTDRKNDALTPRLFTLPPEMAKIFEKVEETGIEFGNQDWFERTRFNG
jgi:hypothetical protein